MLGNIQTWRPGLKPFVGQIFLVRSARCAAGRGPCSAFATFLYFWQQHNWSYNSYFPVHPPPLQKWQRWESNPLPQNPKAPVGPAAALVSRAPAVRLGNLAACHSGGRSGSKGAQCSSVQQENCFPASVFDQAEQPSASPWPSLTRELLPSLPNTSCEYTSAKWVPLARSSLWLALPSL